MIMFDNIVYLAELFGVLTAIDACLSKVSKLFHCIKFNEIHILYQVSACTYLITPMEDKCPKNALCSKLKCYEFYKQGVYLVASCIFELM